MLLSGTLLLAAVAGVLSGAALIGTWAIGVVIVAMSAGLGTYAILRDVPDRPVRPEELRSARERVRRRARDAA